MEPVTNTHPNFEIRCGAERPRMEFDTCCLPLDHSGDFHEDEDGNTWSVNFHDWANSRS